MASISRTMAAAIAPLALLTGYPSAAQAPTDSGALFALLDENEWCPGGSVHLDLATGSFSLYPRPARAVCADPETRADVEQGRLDVAQLRIIRSAYREVRRAGLRCDRCDLVVSNGGPQTLVVTAPGFSGVTPENEGCWTEEATKLHAALFKIFGRSRLPGE